MSSKTFSLQKTNIREIFLKEFINSIILSKIPKENRILKPQAPKILVVNQIKPPSLIQPPKPMMNFPKPMMNFPKPRVISQQPRKPQQQRSSQGIFPPQAFMPQQPKANPIQNIPIQQNAKQINPSQLGLEKISPILSDPSIVSLECPGASKPIIVNRSGRIQTTQLVLTKQEIQNIVEKISEQTKIPLLSGVFKAAFNNFIITAIVSDYIGTRFMIQKKSFS